MPSKKYNLCNDYFNTNFNLMYDSIFRDKFDTCKNRFDHCYYEYINDIKYNRSKRRYTRSSNKYILYSMFNKTLIEEKMKLKNISKDVILPADYVKSSLPAILPDSITNIIYSYYNSLQPYIRELQDWFGEDSDTKNYDDNFYEAQASLILDFVDVDKYFPNTDINRLRETDYFKSHNTIDNVDGTPVCVEVKSSRILLNNLRNNKIPYQITLPYNEGETMIDYKIPFEPDSD